MPPEKPTLLPNMNEFGQTIVNGIARLGGPQDSMGDHLKRPSILRLGERRAFEQDSLAGAETIISLLTHKEINPFQQATLNVLEQNKIITPDQKKSQIESLQTQDAVGIDISHWKGDLPPVWFENLAEAGYQFVYIKSVGGSVNHLYHDPNFIQNVQRAKEADLIVGAYIFCNPSKSIKEQVQETMTYAGPEMSKLNGGIALDLEITNNQSATTIENKMVEAIGFMSQQPEIKHTLVYSSAGFLNDLIGFSLDDVADMYFPWIASWKAGDTPTMPLIWKNIAYTIWQNTNNLMLNLPPLGNKSFDGNRMSREFYDRITGTEPPPGIPPFEELPEELRWQILADYLDHVAYYPPR